MEIVKKYKNIVIGIVVLALLGFAYMFLFSGDQSAGTNLLLVGAAVQDPEDVLRNQLLELLLQLRVLRLDETIFKDPVFTSLTDFSVDLSPQPVGKDNPFLPLNGDSGSSVSAKSTTPSSSNASKGAAALPGS